MAKGDRIYLGGGAAGVVTGVADTVEEPPAGAVMTADGWSAAPTAGQVLGPNGFEAATILKYKRTKKTASGSHAFEANVQYAIIEMVGAGGSSGNGASIASTAVATAGGGGAGGYIRIMMSRANCKERSSWTCTVGAAKTASSLSDGNPTYFGNVGAGGGAKGKACWSSSLAHSGGGLGGAGLKTRSQHTEHTYATLHRGQGANGSLSLGSDTTLIAGSGGISVLGSGGGFTGSVSEGGEIYGPQAGDSSGYQYGNGGRGTAYNTNKDYASQAGVAGVIIVHEYYYGDVDVA